MLDDEKVILNELRDMQKDKENWKNNIDDVAVKLNGNYSVDVKAKALWILGEMGLRYPQCVESYVEEIAGYLEDEHPKLRERSLNALGRIGRADKNLVVPYVDKLMKKRSDSVGAVRLSFVWACENIATNAPDLFFEKLDLFFELLGDCDDKVRMEAPEMFRVIGKRKPECVKPYLDRLECFSRNDEHRVVRIHCAGAVRITKKALGETSD